MSVVEKGLRGAFVVALLLSFVFVLYCLCWTSAPLSNLRSENEHELSRRLFPKRTFVKSTYLFIVGVEGVGHHGVSPAIASIAQSCQQHVIYEHQVLRAQLTHMNSVKFRSALAILTNFMHPKPVLFIEGSSFPTDKVHRYAPDSKKREFGLYNINWLYDQAKLLGMDIKFLHLTRDFYRTVASHPEFDGTFEKHAQVLHDYLWYIDSEFRSIEAKESGLWRQIKYEWFTEMENCPALVSAVVDFMGWTECNLARACTILKDDLRAPTKRKVNETAYAYAQQFRTNVSTPLLDLSPTKKYSFVNNVHLPEPVVDKKKDTHLGWHLDGTLSKTPDTEAPRVQAKPPSAKSRNITSYTASSKPGAREKFVHRSSGRSARRPPIA